MRDFGQRNLNRKTLDASAVFPTDTGAVHRDWLARLGPSAERRVFDAAKDMVRNTTQTARNQIDERNAKRTLADRHAIEWHRKLFLAFACILLFLMAPRAIIRKEDSVCPPCSPSSSLCLYVVTIMGDAWSQWCAVPCHVAGHPAHGPRCLLPELAGREGEHLVAVFPPPGQPVT